jgi:uncharacterized MAPEG superfamily protein
VVPAMSFELQILLWSTIFALAHVSVQSFTYKAQVGNKLTVGARDDDPAPAVLAGRAARAFRNFLETYPVFVALTLVVSLSDQSDGYTQWGAGIYLGFRIVYLPLYLVGAPWWRTISWNFATAGLAAMILGVFI